MKKRKERRLCQCGCGCGCDDWATTTDEHGIPVCDICADYTVCDDGEVVCARQGLGARCHVCDTAIEWGAVQTGNAGNGGTPNHRWGGCDCGSRAWIDEDLGGWGHYRYRGKT